MPHEHGLGSSRRGFLGLLGAGAVSTLAGLALARNAGAAAGPGAQAGAGQSSLVPRTLARSSAGGVARPGFPVEYVGVQWSDGGVGGRIRFADQAGRFGAWQQVGCGCAAGAGDGVVAPFGSALVPAGEATAYEVELASGGSTVALNTTAGPLTRVPLGTAAVSSQLVGLDFVSRAEWGADESLRFDETGAERYPQTYWPAQTLTVHHTATQNNDPDPAARVRAIYRFHTIDQSFGDIGYHFLIDEAGRVYEGRFSGDDGTPGFDTAGRMVNAAHVGGFNAGNVGIALLGTFVDRAPTRAARTALTELLAKIAGWVHLDPRANTTYVNPISGATRTVPTIPGHRDWAATECPGGFLYSALPPIRRDVARLLRRSA